MEALIWIITAASIPAGLVAGIVLFRVTQPWLDRRHDRTCPDPWRFHGRGRPNLANLDVVHMSHKATR